MERIATQSFTTRDTHGLGYTEPVYQDNNGAYGSFNTKQDARAYNAYVLHSLHTSPYRVCPASTSHEHSTDYTHAAVDYGLQYPPGTTLTTQELENQYATASTHPYVNPFTPRGVACTPANHNSLEPPIDGSQDSFSGRGQRSQGCGGSHLLLPLLFGSHYTDPDNHLCGKLFIRSLIFDYEHPDMTPLQITFLRFISLCIRSTTIVLLATCTITTG